MRLREGWSYKDRAGRWHGPLKRINTIPGDGHDDEWLYDGSDRQWAWNAEYTSTGYSNTCYTPYNTGSRGLVADSIRLSNDLDVASGVPGQRYSVQQAFEDAMPSLPTLESLEAIMPISAIPFPSNVPADAACSIQGEGVRHAGPIRLRVINAAENDATSYICHLHAYDVLSSHNFAHRVDLDAVILNPYFLNDDYARGLTRAEYRERITECPRCGCEVDRNSLGIPPSVQGVQYEGEPICPNCRDSWYATCRECGTVRQVSYGDSMRSYTCDTCARFAINPSKRKPQPIFFKIDNDNDTRFTGAEIELEFDRLVKRNEVTRKLLEPLPEKLMHAESDGSLMWGVEYVTMPLSAQYLKANRGIFEKFYDTANNYVDVAATARNAGLHVHLSRNIITPEEAMRMEKLVTKSGLMSRYLLHLTKRTPDKFSQWAATSPDPTIVDGLRVGRNEPCGNRYRFLNWSKHTVECRGFAGSHDLKHFFAAMQFVRALHDFTKHSDYENKCVAFRKFIANNTDYAELQQYDASFIDSKKEKTGNEAPTTTDQSVPGQFTHRGTMYGLYNGTAPWPHDVYMASAGEYTERVMSRISNARIDIEVFDSDIDHTYTFSANIAADMARIRLNNGERVDIRLPITTDRMAVLAALRTEIARSIADNRPEHNTTVLVGSYVFTQLEQLRTMGELSSVPALSGDSDDDEQYDSDDGDGF